MLECSKTGVINYLETLTAINAFLKSKAYFSELIIVAQGLTDDGSDSR
jgi:hypothetical protein